MLSHSYILLVFFFQAEDGIRDLTVTGVQTCALPILFERFDALGKPLPTWNLAAGLFTLPWCGLRGLWQEGGLYALAAGGTGLVWGLLLRPALGLPPAIAHGIDATLILLAIAIPGLGANALYWHQIGRAHV